MTAEAQTEKESPVPPQPPAAPGEAAPGESGAVESGSVEQQPTSVNEAKEPQAETAPSAAPVPAPAAEETANAPADTTPDAGEAPTETSTPASDRILIGTQRPDDEAEGAKAEPQFKKPETEAEALAKKQKSYPPPNAKAQLSPELEKELEDALAGQSLDAIIDGSALPAATEELAPDAKVTGTVINIHREDVFLDLGGPHQGVLPLKQFTEGEAGAAPEIGASIEAVVGSLDEEQGFYRLSLTTAAVEVGNWDDVEAGQTVEVTITGTNKGGLECQVSGLRGFIPMGQVSVFRVENPEEYVGQKIACVVTEANQSRKNLVLSRRAVMERERAAKKEELLQKLSKGDVLEGTVRNLLDFGAFVDLGGVDGLIHVSQLSWDRVGHPKEVLEVGQKVKVRIEKIDKDSGKIGLAYRDLAANPWQDADSKYAVGSTIKGTVSKLMQFGAFVKLEPGVEGLIHISELGHGRVQRTGDVVSEGQEVEAKVLTVDTSAQRIGLSLKALMPAPKQPERKPREEKVAVPSEEEQQKRSRERQKDKNLKGGLGGPSGGDQFGLKW
ncbi:MAG: S1 RNA-binding domain-containing protein [Planctomycetota bacterium]